jgi:hypothetical protein
MHMFFLCHDFGVLRQRVSADLSKEVDVGCDDIFGDIEEVVLHIVGERRRVRNRAVRLAEGNRQHSFWCCFELLFLSLVLTSVSVFGSAGAVAD